MAKEKAPTAEKDLSAEAPIEENNLPAEVDSEELSDKN